MRAKFSPSINVLRDEGEDFGYIETPNAQRVANEILAGEQNGIHSFQLIGSYGTGKSAFLLAFANALTGKAKHFAIKPEKKQPKVISLVGEYRSLLSFLAEHFEVKSKQPTYQQTFDAIHERYEKAGHVYLIIDEFGKFLEHAAKHDPEREMFFIQQLAEFANKPDRQITLIVTLHQSIDAYGGTISSAQRMEWRKVQGRLRELPFNEPIEHLIHLAAGQLSKDKQAVPKGLDLGAIAKLAEKHTLFEDHKATWSKEELTRLYPLDIIATHALTKGLQMYGQNERSLFTFLEARGVRLRKGASAFGLPDVFDHLNSEFYSFLRGSFNPHRRQWEMIWSAMERVEVDAAKDRSAYMDIVKTIGLLQLVGSRGAAIDGRFISTYLGSLYGGQALDNKLKELTARKILLFVKHRGSYKLQEGTDLDLDSELRKAESRVEAIGDVVLKLAPHFRHKYVAAKEVTYRKGSPRIFEFRLSHTPLLHEKPKAEVDGIINLVLNGKQSLASLKKASLEAEEAIVYGHVKNTDVIIETLLNIERTQQVIAENEDDKVAVKELRTIRQHHVNLLDHYIHDALFSQDTVQWVHRGEQQPVKDVRSFNQLLSRTIDVAYPSAPTFRNELVNRESVSPSASTARKALFEHICEDWDKEELGFVGDEFPAERAIYTTLLKENGMHRKGTDGYDLFPPDTDSSFMAVWQECERFLTESKHGRKDISELMERLGERPFKLKYGLVELWVPLFLFVKRGDYALYQNDAFIPQLTGPVLYMMTRQPREFQVKAFALDKVRQRLFKRYKAFLGKEEVEHLTNGDLIDITRPFLSFYRNLSPYAQSTDRIGPEAKDLREAIKQATDPEKTFFEDLPKAMRLSLEEAGDSDEQLGRFIGVLSSSLDQLQQATARLAERIDTFIGEVVLGTGDRFPKTRQELASRLNGIREHQLLDHLTPLYKRTVVPLDQCEAWIASIAQGAIGKPIDRFTDRDEEVLKERLLAHYRELMGLADVHRTEKDADGAPVLRMQITTSRKGTRTEMIHYPSKQRKKVEAQVRVLKSKLDDDPAIRRAVLAWLLNDELDKA
ncbi:MAG TPA: ATP-binding protein [Flavobacteriales bacterium]|nr:ATP-binding protein [Flavobacteriales bacterium]